MKKIMLGVCCALLVAGMLSTRFATDVINAQGGDVINPSDTSLAMDLSIDEMVSQSDLIAIGNCINTRSVWVGRNLVTLATISVAETLKGDGSSQVTVTLPGGADANRKIPIAMTYPGAPRVSPGEDVFLFLVHEDEVAGTYAVTGFAQGKFSIVKDEEGREVISRDLTNVRLQGKAGIRQGTSSSTSLETLKALVRQKLQKN